MKKRTDVSASGAFGTRREFLKATTATAAAAVAVPYAITSTALGAADRPPASDRIVMGAIGVGGRGSSDMRGFMNFREVQMVAVCDCFRDRRDRAKAAADKRYGDKGCTAYADFRELLARDDIEAVSIATPEHWHALHIVEAARHGKDIFCEKPLTLTLGEARAAVDAVRRYGRVMQTGTQQRSDGRFRFACELVRNGRIGKLISVHVSTGGPSGPCNLPAEAVPDGFDWEMWLGPAPWAPYNRRRCWNLFSWWNWRDYSGGQMTDRGAHDFDIAQWGLGMDESGPVEIFPPDGKQHERLTYKYANGVLLYSGDRRGRWTTCVTFKGTEGLVAVRRGGLRTDPPSLARATIGPGELHLYKSNNHPGNFLHCIRTRERTVADVEIGCRSVSVCHLGNIAYWLERPLKWDPEKERFINDAEANRMLDCPKRAPWRL